MPKKKPKSSPKSPPKKRKLAYNAKQLTQHLRELAAEVETMDEKGNLITRGEALAKMLWKKALGYVEITEAADGIRKEVIVKPASWAIQLIWERMEGKVPMAITEDKGHQTAASKVSELVRSQINSLSEAVVAIPDQGGPVDRSDHEDKGSEGPDKESGMESEAPGSG